MNKTLLILLAAGFGIWWYNRQNGMAAQGETVEEQTTTQRTAPISAPIAAPVSTVTPTSIPMVSDSPANVLLNISNIATGGMGGTAVSTATSTSQTSVEKISSQPTPLSAQPADSKAAICSAMGGVYLGGGKCKTGSLISQL